MKSDMHIYLYNAAKANFFIQNGAQILEIGRSKNGEVYYKFLKNDQTMNITNRWKELQHINK